MWRLVGVYMKVVRSYFQLFRCSFRYSIMQIHCKQNGNTSKAIQHTTIQFAIIAKPFLAIFALKVLQKSFFTYITRQFVIKWKSTWLSINIHFISANVSKRDLNLSPPVILQVTTYCDLHALNTFYVNYITVSYHIAQLLSANFL